MPLSKKRNWFDPIRDYWCWWTSELEQSIPPSLAGFISRDVNELHIRMEGDLAHLELITPKGKFVVEELDLDAEEAKKASLRQTLFDKLPAHKNVSLHLPEEIILRHRFMLPQSTEASLHNVLRFELDRLTPFRPEQASFGYRLAGRYPENEKIMVELVLVKQDYLNHLLHRLGLFGLQPDGVYPENDFAERLLPTLNMIPPEQRPPKDPLFAGAVRRLALMAAVLLLVVGLFPQWQLSHREGLLQQAINDVRKDASQVAARQSLLASRLGAQDFLAERKNNSPGKLAMLQEITRLLPDNTWVTGLDISGDTVTLRGESHKASDLIALLEQSDYFHNVVFGSSVTRNAVTNSERYEIRMELVTQ